MKRKSYKLLVLLFLLLFFSCFDVKAENKDYFKLPGNEIVVPTGYEFTCDYNNKADKNQYGFAITFINGNFSNISLYTGKNYDDGYVSDLNVSVEKGELYSDSLLSIRDKFTVDGINNKEDYLTFPQETSIHFDLSFETNASISTNNMKNFSKSLCPQYLYIFHEPNDNRSDTVYEFKLSNTLYSDDPSAGFVTGCKKDKRNECIKVCGDGSNNCDATAMVIKEPKTIFLFENNGQTESEANYQKKYCSSGTCKVDVDDDDVDSADNNVEVGDITESFDKVEAPKLTCYYDTMFIANLANSNGNPNFSSGDGCVSGSFVVQLLGPLETDEYNKMTIRTNNLPSAFSGSNSGTFAFCSDEKAAASPQECDARDGATSYLNIEDFIEKDGTKCPDELYWVYDGNSVAILPDKNKLKEYAALDFYDCEGKDKDSYFCQNWEMFENSQEDRKRLFTAVLVKTEQKLSDGTIKQTSYDNNPTCPINRYEVDPSDIPKYDSSKYEIVFDCATLGELSTWLSGLFIAIQVGCMVLIVILTALDVMKAISSFEDKNMKKVWNRLIIRLVVLALLFLLKPLCVFLLNFFGFASDNSSFCI